MFASPPSRDDDIRDLSGMRVAGANLQDREHGTVIHIYEPNALTQVVGWLKFRSTSGHVVYRGQNAMYQSLSASAFRLGTRGMSQRHAAAMREYIDSLAGPCLCGTRSFAEGHRCLERVSKPRAGRGLILGSYRAALEPLLQHYGLRTRWLDLVDNIWVALWFACHAQIGHGRHAFHLRRSATEDAKAYVYVIDAGRLAETGIPGYSLGPSVRLVDLRYCVPSLYLRPHAQHGLLAAPAKLDAGGDLSHRVAAVLEIDLRDALDWLGRGAMLDPFVLFPSAVRDSGYRRLLDLAPQPPEVLGAITLYGSGY